MTPFEVDVLIAGAGPTGLMAAAEAIQSGLKVRVVDGKPHRSTYSKALVMHARTLEVLEGLDVARRIVSAGARFEALNVRFDQRDPVRVDLGALKWGDTDYRFWLSIPQYDTERILEDRLMELGGAVEWNTSLTELTQDAEGVDVTLEQTDGTTDTCRARWVIGADGARSQTREQVGVSMQRQSLKQTFVLADIKTTCDLAPAEGHTWHGKEGLLLIVPMPERDYFRIIAHVPGADPDHSLTLDAPFFDDLIRKRTGIEFGSHDLDWTSQFLLSQGLSGDYRDRRVFLAGDAAHVHSPVGGQGMNTGIQDAHNLVWKLALAKRLGDENAAEPWLDSYEQERRPAAQSMVQGTGRATKVLTTTNAFLRPLVGVVASRAAAMSRVQQRLGRGVGMLKLGYRTSDVLDRRRLRGSHLIPGQRLPNATLAEGRLHARLDAGGHTLLVIGDEVRIVTATGEQALVTGDAEALRAALGVEGQVLVLVRPDRCVAGLWSSRQAMNQFEPARRVVQLLEG